MVLRPLVVLVLIVLSLMPRARADAKIPFIDLYTTHGRPDRFAIAGRAIQVSRSQLVESGRGTLGSLVHNIRRFAPSEFEHRTVRLKIHGHELDAHTDDEGLFRLEVQSPKRPLPPGLVEVSAHVLDFHGKPMDPVSTGTVQIVGKRARYAIVSDIDDTILVSNVQVKRTLIWNTFAQGVENMKPVTGMADIYRELMATGPDHPALFYLSGSPLDLHRKILAFLERNQFPPGSVILKNLGVKSVVPKRFEDWRPFTWLDPADSLTRTIDYKTGHIKRLLADLPDLKFILVGDSGEKDPEIYGQIARDPALSSRIAAVYIRNATGEKAQAERFRGQLLFDAPAAMRADLVKRKILVRGR